jgi:hypothetical protein
VYRALCAGRWGPWLLDGWQAVLAAGIVTFAVGRIVVERSTASLQWPRMALTFQAVALAGLLVALQLFSWAGISPTFIYFKF